MKILKMDASHSFIEEDAFEKIINYFEEKEELVKALEAAELASNNILILPCYLIKKADILLANASVQGSIGNT